MATLHLTFNKSLTEETLSDSIVPSNNTLRLCFVSFHLATGHALSRINIDLSFIHKAVSHNIGTSGGNHHITFPVKPGDVLTTYTPFINIACDRVQKNFVCLLTDGNGVPITDGDIHSVDLMFSYTQAHF